MTWGVHGISQFNEMVFFFQTTMNVIADLTTNKNVFAIPPRKWLFDECITWMPIKCLNESKNHQKQNPFLNLNDI